MTSRLLFPLAIGVLATSHLFAQGTFTSPKGFDTTEGATNHNYILASKVGLTFQQLDGTNRGTVAALKSIAWRRDGTGATNTTYTARQLEMEVLMADTIVANVSTVHSANYKNPPTVVFTKKMVNAPDWTQMPVSAPAPWDLKAPFDTSWVYLGIDDFVWEVRVTQNSAVTGTTGLDYGFDFDYIGQSGATFSAAATATNIGTGCISTGRTAAFSLAGSLNTHANRLRLVASGSNAPSSTTVVLFVDAVDSNLTVPMLCGVARALPTLTFPLGTSSATGSVASVTFDNLPFAPYFVGVPLVMQSVAIDMGQAGFPVSLSNGRRYVIAAPPSNVGTIARVDSYLSGTTTTAPSQWTGGLITQFAY